MKILQGLILNILLLAGIISAQGQTHASAEALAKADLSAVALAKGDVSAEALAKGDVSAKALAKADSLFHLKQYTQSLELYNSLFESHQYSPSMLLKMAYIQEGLGHLAQSLYFLNLYYLSSSDNKALIKLEEVARKNNLAGYNDSDTSLLVLSLKEHASSIALGIIALSFFLIILSTYQKYKLRMRPIGTAIGLASLLLALFVFNFWSSSHGQGIIANSSTYLMSGPSAGAKVVSIVGEGNRLDILGQHDVWLKVLWNEQEVFVKENEVLPVRL